MAAERRLCVCAIVHHYAQLIVSAAPPSNRLLQAVKRRFGRFSRHLNFLCDWCVVHARTTALVRRQQSPRRV